MSCHQARADRSRAAAHRYQSDPERFVETHDPEALARQIPLKMKRPRIRPVEAEPAEE